MRAAVLGLVALLLLVLLVVPGRVALAEEMTDAERETALKRAAEHAARMLELWQGGKYQDAEQQARQALVLREKALGPRHPLVARSALDLGNRLFDLGRYADARPLLDRALEIFEETLDPEHPVVAESLSALATLLWKQGHWEEARPLVERAIRIREEAFGPEHPRVAESLNVLALLLKSAGRYKEARPLYERALRILEKAHGARHPWVASLSSSLALLLEATGDHGQALPLHERALSIWEKVYGPEHLMVAMSLNNLASALKALGRYDRARPLYERALRIYEGTAGSKHPTYASCLNNLALLLRDMGRYEEARPLFVKALALHREVYGPEHPLVVTSLNNLAVLLHELGAYEEARPLYTKALEIRERTLGPEHPDVAVSLDNLATMLNTLGARDEATALFERALEIREKALGPSGTRVAESLSHLAGLVTKAGRHDEARPLFERALSIWEKAYGSDHPTVAAGLCNLAMLHQRQGAYAAARPLHERALEVREKAFGPVHPDVASSLHDLVTLLGRQGSYEEALPYAERARAIREAVYGSDHAEVAASLHDLAVLFDALGRPEAARARFEECLKIHEESVRRRFAGLLARQRRGLMATLRGYLSDWLLVAPKTGETGYSEVLRFKGLVARATAVERRLARRGGPETAPHVVALRASERRLARFANVMPPAVYREKHAAWKEAYAKAGAEREELALALARECTRLRLGWGRLGLGLEDVQARLGSDEVLVDVLRVRDTRTSDRYLAWVVHAAGAVQRLDLGRASDIESAAVAFVEAVAHGGTKPTDDAWVATGRALKDLVFAPIGSRLAKGVRTVYFCPDAALAAVPLHALPGRSGGRTLLDEHLVIQVSTAQELVPWEKASPRGGGGVVVGGVDYRTAAKVTDLPIEPPPHGVAHRAPRGPHYRPIPETRTEAESIERQMGDGCRVLLGGDATEAGLRAVAKGRRFLHLATHGFVRDDLMHGLMRRASDPTWFGAAAELQLAAGHDPMLLAGLAMAGANARDGGHGDDGILTALEASHLDLDGVELVVLSACQTALGKAESGEGVIGLVRGFQMAGARQVIGSLWKVDDEATRALMVKFYELWSPKDGSTGLDAPAALRKAQEHVRGQETWKHPYYWAAWVSWGVSD